MDIGSLTGFVDLDTGPMESALDGLNDFMSQHAGKWTKILGGAGLAAAGAFGASLVGAMDAEPANDKLAAQLGLSAKESERMGKIAGDLYANNYGESMGDVDDAIHSVVQNIDGMRGASAKSLSGVTASVMDVSKAFDQDLGATTAAVGQMMRTGMAKNATEALDILTKGLQGPANKADDLMDTMNEYGTQFRKLGLNGKDAMGIISQGMKAGARDADVVADAMKEFSIRAVDGSKTTIDGFQKLGLNADVMAEKIGKGGKSASVGLDQVMDRLRGVKDPVQQAQIATELFGTQAEDLGKALYAIDPSSAAKSLGKVGGAAKAMGKTLNDNAKGNIESFKRHITTAFVETLGNKVLPVVTDVTGKLTPAFDGVGDAISSVTKFMTEHKGVAITLATVMGGLVGVTMAYDAAMAVQAAGGIMGFIKGLKLIQSVTKVGTAIQWAYNIALEANPLVLIVTLIAAVVVALVLFFTKTEIGRKIISAAFDGIKAAAKAVADFFTKDLPDAAVQAWTWISDTWTSAVDWFKDLPGKIGKAVAGLFDKAQTLASDAISWVEGKFLDFVTWYYSMPGKIAKAAAGLFDKVKNLAKDGKDYAVDKFNALVDWVRGLPGKISRAAGGLFDKVKNLAKDAKDYATGKFDDLVGWVRGLPGRMSRAASGLWDGLKSSFRSAINWLIGKWNGLSFSLPGITAFGHTISGFTLNTPNIPYLATGARVGAYRPMTAVIGDAPEPENVLRDSQLAAVVAAGVRMVMGDQKARGDVPMIGEAHFHGQDPDAVTESLWFKLRTRGA